MSIDAGCNYTMIDSLGALVSKSFPYKRDLEATYDFGEHLKGPAFLLYWVKTSYSTYKEAASVRIDGKEVGKVSPRPWVNQFLLDLEADIIVFDSSLIEHGFVPSSDTHALEIITVGQSYLILGVVLCAYNVVS